MDALEVARLADEVTALRQGGDPAAVVDACTAALGLFRGESLFGASDADWLRPHRAQLETLRLRLIEDQLGARLDLGATGDVVGELEELVTAHPLREGLWEMLITALYRAGRQADALAAYRTRAGAAGRGARDRARAASCSDSSSRCSQQDPDLDAPAAPAPAAPAPASAPVTGGNLPPLSSIVGRPGPRARGGRRARSPPTGS